MTFQEIKTLVSNSANLTIGDTTFFGMFHEAFNAFCTDTNLYKNIKIVDITDSTISYGGKIARIFSIKNTAGESYDYTIVREGTNEIKINVQGQDMEQITTGEFFISYSYIPNIYISLPNVEPYNTFSKFPLPVNSTKKFYDIKLNKMYKIVEVVSNPNATNPVTTYDYALMTSTEIDTFVLTEFFIFPDEYLKGIISALLAQAYLRKSEEYMKNEDVELHNIFSEKATYYNNIYSEVRKKCIKNTENTITTLPDVKQHDLGDI